MSAPGSLADVEAAVRADLLERYAEPHRDYHDGRHLAEVLAAIELITMSPDGPRLDAEQLGVVRLAAWFHDAVYDPTAEPGANEEASALLAERTLTARGLAALTVERVASMVRATATHEPMIGTSDEATFDVLCDADLAVLGSSDHRYDEYTAAIQSEYAHVPDDDFRSGRAKILRDFLDRPRIYRTPPAYDAWEARARVALAREIASLTDT